MRVWDLPLRVTHWALAVAVLTAWCTANVFNTVHELAGYAALGLTAFRILWGFVGGPYARFRGFARPPSVVLRYLWRIARGRKALQL